jgi:transposase
MEACLSAHVVSRVLRQLGHQPRIIPAIHAEPFVKGQKNDYNDAEAIAEAALRPNFASYVRRSRTSSTCRLSCSFPSGLAGRRLCAIPS